MRKSILLIVVFILVLVLLTACFSRGQQSFTPTNSPAKETFEPTKSTLETTAQVEDSYFDYDDSISNELPKNDFSIDIVRVLTDIGYTIEQATGIQKILYQVGVNSIEILDEVTSDVSAGLDPIRCYANGNEELQFWFTTEDGVLFYCGFMGEDLYDTSQGGVLMEITDVHIPETEVSISVYNELQQLASDYVEEYLSYPESANFHALDWQIGRSDNNYKIIGIVSAQNSFGINREMNFSVWFISENNKYTIEAIMIDEIRVL